MALERAYEVKLMGRDLDGERGLLFFFGWI